MGSLISVRLDVRFIAATNTNLVEDIKKGRFREDLFYRLNVLPLHLPPLRERVDEIPLMFKSFVEKYAKMQNKRIAGIDKKVIEILMRYSWPGNIRELQNLAEMLVSLSEDGAPIYPEALPDNFFQEQDVENLIHSISEYKILVRSFERKLIIKILQRTGWNKNEAAKIMKIHRNTLLKKLKSLEIPNL